MKDIYIDFDRTIYNTDKIYKDIINLINKYDITEKIIEQEKKAFFKEPILFNYIELLKYICKKYKKPLNIVNEVIKIIKDGDNYIYNDVIPFFKLCKKNKFRINILTYGDLNFQLIKLINLKINRYIDNIIIASNYKYDLKINYKNSIFIDDNPRDLIGLSNNGAYKIIRIKRIGAKYSSEKIKSLNINTHKNLKSIKIEELL